MFSIAILRVGRLGVDARVKDLQVHTALPASQARLEKV